MRKAGKTLSILLALGMCLGGSVTARADHTPPARDDRPLVLSGDESVTLRDETIAAPINVPDGHRAPWPLGVNGDSRAVTWSGDTGDLNLVDCSVTAGGWGALCVVPKDVPHGTYPGESGTFGDTNVTVLDTDLRIAPAGDGGLDAGSALLGLDPARYGSGYCALLAGGASAYFHGAALSGGTYGAVLNGTGRVWFGSSDGTVLLYDGADLTGAERGKGQASRIDGVFGLMMCGDADRVTVCDGTELHAADAVVLCKNGGGAFTFDNARLSSDSGVLFQMMDSDDDERIGLLTGTYGYSPVYDERNISADQGFPETDREIVRAISEKLADSDALPPAAQSQHVHLTYQNGLYSGDIYNGTGYYGQPGDSLTVTVGGGAVLDGDISLTSTAKAIPYSRAAAALLDSMDGVRYCLTDGDGAPCDADHAVYIRLTRYTIDQYYLQGHVQNLPCYNGAGSLDVTVARGGTWVVGGVSLVTSLTVADGALVYGQVTDNGDGSLTLSPADEPLAPGTYVPEAAAAAFAPAEQTPVRQVEVTVGGREYPVDVYEYDGKPYVRLADLLPLFIGEHRGPEL